MRLAQIAARSGSSLTERFFDVSESLHGISPRLTMARALLCTRDSDVAAGLRLFDDERARAGKNVDALEWSLMRATLHGTLATADAATGWITLADQNPESLAAQLGCLSSTPAWKDREAIRRVLERTKGLTYEEGTTWRLARGRWLLEDPEGTAETFADATVGAPQDIDVAISNGTITCSALRLGAVGTGPSFSDGNGLASLVGMLAAVGLVALGFGAPRLAARRS